MSTISSVSGRKPPTTSILRKRERKDTILRIISALIQWNLKRTTSKWETVTGESFFLREYASYIKDSMVAELTDLNRNMMMSIDIVPVPMDEAVREVENRLLGVETNITNWQRKQNQNNNFSATVPYDMEQQKKGNEGVP